MHHAANRRGGSTGSTPVRFRRTINLDVDAPLAIRQIQAEWDQETPPARSQGLFPLLTAAPWRDMCCWVKARIR
jgi:hypothetical protein